MTESTTTTNTAEAPARTIEDFAEAACAIYFALPDAAHVDDPAAALRDVGQTLRLVAHRLEAAAHCLDGGAPAELIETRAQEARAAAEALRTRLAHRRRRAAADRLKAEAAAMSPLTPAPQQTWDEIDARFRALGLA